MASALQRRSVGVITSTTQVKSLNAESVTAIATGFIKRIGHKGKLKPKRVSLEEGTYTVEVDMSKLAAVVKIDAETHDIKEYEINARGEESSLTSISPKLIIIVFGLAAVTNLMLTFLLRMLGI